MNIERELEKDILPLNFFMMALYLWRMCRSVSRMARKAKDFDSTRDLYNTTVMVMRTAILLALRSVSYKLGASNYQESSAELEALCERRGINVGVYVINKDDLLYPQYNDRFPTRLQVIRDNLDELRAEINRRKINPSRTLAPAVRKHWDWILSLEV